MIGDRSKKKPRQLVSKLTGKVFANLEKFCWLARWVFGIFINYLDDPKNIQIV